MKPKKIKVMKTDGTIIGIMPHALKDALKLGYHVVPEKIEDEMVYKEPKLLQFKVKGDDKVHEYKGIDINGHLPEDDMPAPDYDCIDLAKGVREITKAVNECEDLGVLNGKLDDEAGSKGRKSVIACIEKRINKLNG